MLLFQLEDQVQTWCDQTHENRGTLLSIEQVWELSKVWYAHRMQPDYRGRTAAEAEAVFAQVGLTSDFWKF